MVPRPQLRRVDERHVQESQRSGEAHWVVPHGSQAARFGFGNQRAIQEIHPQPAVGHH
jgi:hypothetical protein